MEEFPDSSRDVAGQRVAKVRFFRNARAVSRLGRHCFARGSFIPRADRTFGPGSRQTETNARGAFQIGRRPRPTAFLPLLRIPPSPSSLAVPSLPRCMFLSSSATLRPAPPPRTPRSRQYFYPAAVVHPLIRGRTMLDALSVHRRIDPRSSLSLSLSRQLRVIVSTGRDLAETSERCAKFAGWGTVVQESLSVFLIRLFEKSDLEMRISPVPRAGFICISLAIKSPW